MKNRTSVVLLALTIFILNNQVFASDKIIQQTLKSKGSAVVCSQTYGVFQVEDLSEKLNLKIQSLKGKFKVSQPTLSVSTLNIKDSKEDTPGALAVLCVTLKN